MAEHGGAMTRFSAPTRAWFASAFPAGPTPAQLGAWDAIAAGQNALVIAPTGSGKTLAAFLSALDSFVQRPSTGATRVLYISPLKALGVDVERNLKLPLEGIADAVGQESDFVPPTVGVRSGDTLPSERRRLLAKPPDILITTPESLYLMLTSRAAETLAGVETVIVDEVHAVAGEKRGAHLALSLERLDALLPHPAQRIGLSATVEPHAEVARFLGGARPVEVVAPPSAKRWELSVRVPVEDMAALPEDDERNGSMWPHIEREVFQRVSEARSTIVFANSRRTAERLTSRLNELADGVAPLPSAQPAMMPGQSGMSYGAESGLARAHHGSVSKEHRAQIEADLKSGALRCVVATSSLELGIDMGLVDQVIQIEAPFSVASALQRVGRAGHQVGAPSVGVFFPAHRGDLLATAVTVRRMREGAIESLAVPTNPLDVLAQQTVAACALGPVKVEEWWALVRRAAPYANLPRSAFDAVLDLLAGKYPSADFAELRPRVVWDREAGTLTGRPGAQRLAVTSGGTIPDRGLYGVFIVGTEEMSRGGRRVGELDEEMVYESRVGDVISLGATSWRIEEITHDRVLVSPAFGHPGRLPFWHGDGLGRPAELGRELGAFQRSLAASRGLSADTEGRRRNQGEQDRAGAHSQLAAIGLDENAQANALAYVREQREATGTVPSDRELVVEQFIDDLGEWRIVLHSPYGMAVHAPWALAVAARIRERSGLECSAVAADDGIVLRLPVGDAEPPGAELFVFDPEGLEEIVRREISGSALFAARFRECAARALLLPNRRPGERAPLWQQRLRARSLLEVAQRYPEFPIVLEAARECLQDVYDLPALTGIAREIGARRIRLTEVRSEKPSPFARQLLFGYVGQFIYDLDAPLADRHAAMLLDPVLLADLLGGGKLREILDPEVIERTELELQRLAPDRQLRGVEGVADLLRILGPLTAREIAARIEGPRRLSGGEAGVETMAGGGVDSARFTQPAEVEELI
ncbi:Lhr-like helicase, partial [Ruaniaceae bacterium KH17]